MDDNEITTNNMDQEEESKISIDQSLVDLWRDEIIRGYNKNTKSFESINTLSDEIANVLFSEIVKIEEGLWHVKFENTYFILSGDNKSFKLTLDEKLNDKPAWFSVKSDNIGGKTGEDVKKENIGVKSNEVNNLNVVEETKKKKRKEGSLTEEEEIEERDNNRKKKVKTDIGDEWVKVKQRDDCKYLNPNSHDNFRNLNFPKDIPLDQIFGITKKWIEHYEYPNTYWNNGYGKNAFNQLKNFNTKDILKSPTIISWFHDLNEEILETRRALKITMELLNILTRKFEGFMTLEKRQMALKTEDNKKVKQLESKINIFQKQLGASTLIGENNKIVFGFKSKIDPVRQKRAKENINKYKSNNTWIEEKDWKKLSRYEKIMKRWVFSDTHQCLSPYDEAVLTKEELKAFHEEKRKWRAERGTELRSKGDRWMINRFNRYCHVRVLKDRMWTGLDLGYEKDVGIENYTSKYYGISWKKYNPRRKLWHEWTWKGKKDVNKQNLKN